MTRSMVRHFVTQSVQSTVQIGGARPTSDGKKRDGREHRELHAVAHQLVSGIQTVAWISSRSAPSASTT
ncbi:hypothetical protein GCM10020358_49110 [Amorphoplanes nipponensis]|uniref:Uncharacterized protein n=1 Tax=Actinoplanes nipponensis TaxID=135950 RepID=A0A919MKR7_9ACTN|nr:hypothetical protein [Actinoplanes nipponensis]GIE53164.1 hypothetical protein Ani05nite_66980 [Actinoplanes nipponensis]